jgi:hypothetical protein
MLVEWPVNGRRSLCSWQPEFSAVDRSSDPTDQRLSWAGLSLSNVPVTRRIRGSRGRLFHCRPFQWPEGSEGLVGGFSFLLSTVLKIREGRGRIFRRRSFGWPEVPGGRVTHLLSSTVRVARRIRGWRGRIPRRQRV